MDITQFMNKINKYNNLLKLQNKEIIVDNYDSYEIGDLYRIINSQIKIYVLKILNNYITNFYICGDKNYNNLCFRVYWTFMRDNKIKELIENKYKYDRLFFDGCLFDNIDFDKIFNIIIFLHNNYIKGN